MPRRGDYESIETESLGALSRRADSAPGMQHLELVPLPMMPLIHHPETPLRPHPRMQLLERLPCLRRQHHSKVDQGNASFTLRANAITSARSASGNSSITGPPNPT